MKRKMKRNYRKKETNAVFQGLKKLIQRNLMRTDLDEQKLVDNDSKRKG